MNIFWLTTSWSNVLMMAITCIGIYIALILITRIVGLRSFSKMSAIDLAITIAIGAIIAGTILTKNPPLLQGLVGMAILYLLQVIMSRLRYHPAFGNLVENKPLLLMRDAKMLDDNLKKARVTRDDIRAELRKANTTQLSHVQAVVMETTGDISVIYDNSDDVLDEELMKSVRGWEKP